MFLAYRNNNSSPTMPNVSLSNFTVETHRNTHMDTHAIFLTSIFQAHLEVLRRMPTAIYLI